MLGAEGRAVGKLCAAWRLCPGRGCGCPTPCTHTHTPAADPHGFVCTCNSTNFFIVRRGEVRAVGGQACLHCGHVCASACGAGHATARPPPPSTPPPLHPLWPVCAAAAAMPACLPGVGAHPALPDARHHARPRAGAVPRGRHPVPRARLLAHAGAGGRAGRVLAGRRGLLDEAVCSAPVWLAAPPRHAGRAAHLLGPITPAPTPPLCEPQVYSADEAFVTGTFAGQIPVREVDGRTIGTGARGPLVQRLQALYAAGLDAEAAAGRRPVVQ